MAGALGEQHATSLPQSVVLEVAFSESGKKLQSVVRFWLDPDNDNVNICLTLRINRFKKEIRVDKWERRNDRAYCSQVIWIENKGDRVVTTHGPLIIPFESLFLRQRSFPRERGIVICSEQRGTCGNNLGRAEPVVP